MTLSRSTAVALDKWLLVWRNIIATTLFAEEIGEVLQENKEKKNLVKWPYTVMCEAATCIEKITCHKF